MFQKKKSCIFIFYLLFLIRVVNLCIAVPFLLYNLKRVFYFFVYYFMLYNNLFNEEGHFDIFGCFAFLFFCRDFKTYFVVILLEPVIENKNIIDIYCKQFFMVFE